MKRPLLIALALIGLVSQVFAQQQKPVDAPVTISAEAQKQFSESQAETQRAYREWRAASERADALPAGADMKERIIATFDIAQAKARHDVAAQAVLTKLYFIMAQLKLSPDEHQAMLTKDGQLQFLKIQPAEPNRK